MQLSVTERERLYAILEKYDQNPKVQQMREFIQHLTARGFCNRTVGIVENGSWAPSAARTMTAQLEEMKAITLLSGTVTVRAALKDADRTALAALADTLAQ